MVFSNERSRRWVELLDDSSVARFILYSACGGGLILHQLPSQRKGGAQVPIIFNEHESALRYLAGAIVFAFSFSFSALIIGDGHKPNKIARSFTVGSLLTAAVALSILAFIFLPD
ncbi:hypothetical protein CCACVL1_15919 [Corchorus capsularis]|uniref:Uncharacterized protein n=1 Tax=Corchorus capsularis TaxID=210143 RepID=A0A1R3I0M5_COCAP|nr:hypothetical protein CCACVL1_15919 [Corchorus capsularis]